MWHLRKNEKITKWQKLTAGLNPNHMHIFKPWKKDVQSCIKIVMKLYKELRLQGTHCLYTSIESEVRKWQKFTKCQKLIQGVYPNHMHIFRPWKKHVQSLKKISINCMKSCAHKVPTVYTFIESEVRKGQSSQSEKVTKINARIISKPDHGENICKVSKRLV